VALVNRITKRQTRVIDALSDHVGSWFTETQVCELAHVGVITVRSLSIKLARPAAADYPYDLQAIAVIAPRCQHNPEHSTLCYRLVRRRRYGVGPRRRRRVLLGWRAPLPARLLPSET